MTFVDAMDMFSDAGEAADVAHDLHAAACERGDWNGCALYSAMLDEALAAEREAIALMEKLRGRA